MGSLEKNLVRWMAFFFAASLTEGQSVAWASVKELLACVPLVSELSDEPWVDKRTEIQLDAPRSGRLKETFLLPGEFGREQGVFLYRGENVSFYPIKSSNGLGKKIDQLLGADPEQFVLLSDRSEDEPLYLDIQQSPIRKTFTLRALPANQGILKSRKPTRLVPISALERHSLLKLSAAVISKIEGIPGRMKEGLAAYDPSGEIPSEELRKRRLDPAKVADALKNCRRGEDPSVKAAVDRVAEALSRISPEFARLWQKPEGESQGQGPASTQPSIHIAPR